MPSAGTNSPPTTRLSPLPLVRFEESQKATELGFATFFEARTVAFAESGAPRATDAADASFVTFRPVFAEADAGGTRSAAQEAHARNRRRGTSGDATTPPRRNVVLVEP